LPKPSAIPFIDVFAGPGGLGEGFSAYTDSRGRRQFESVLSIEKDEHAHRTLMLRSFCRQFPPGDLPEDYYEFLRGEINVDELYERRPAEFEAARHHAWREELGPDKAEIIRRRIDDKLKRAPRSVLLGGPPCQPFSMAGRARNRTGTRYSDGKETRHELYLEYLQIIADHAPDVFVMENVRGLISASFNGVRMLERIYSDLRKPWHAMNDIGRAITNRRRAQYKLYAIGVDADDAATLFEQQDFLVHCERYGVPQARHRLIILGVHKGIAKAPGKLREATQETVRSVLQGMPKLRSGLSRGDNPVDWYEAVSGMRDEAWLRRLKREDPETASEVHASLELVPQRRRADRGARFVECDATTQFEPQWFYDPRLGGVCNHETRKHMERDLHRYMFVSCFGKAHGTSPALRHFPKQLLPNHRSVQRALKGGNFADRFRVQIWNRPSTTIVSHIAKDGHYYIHPDPTQCRALTVREAARLQTFPDNYFFLGNRTQQYTQVGNAVPPLLARQIAGIVADLLA